jgi:hypothetical protein
MSLSSFYRLIAQVAIACLLATTTLPQAQVNGLGVLGIDYGTDWYKVGLVKPGVPLDLVLNKDSKRKTEAVVTIRDGIRQFGIDGASLVSGCIYVICVLFYCSYCCSIVL